MESLLLEKCDQSGPKPPPTHITMSAFLTSFISLLGTDLMILPMGHKQRYLSDELFVTFCDKPRSGRPNTLTVCLTRPAVQTQSIKPLPLAITLTLAVPRFTSGSILSRNWDSMLWGDRKSANSWLLLSSGCCRSFWRSDEKTNKKKG